AEKLQVINFPFFGKTTMQPHPMTSFMQWSVSIAALAVAACAISFTVWTWREKRNADLVKIGVSVLRVDPEKEKQISEATREWALNLIDANAGGVKFSPDARAQLLKGPLKYYADTGYDGYIGFGHRYRWLHCNARQAGTAPDRA
ncbi:MAG: hypothetical protein ACRED2_01520, partial [Methylocella sp.]